MILRPALYFPPDRAPSHQRTGLQRHPDLADDGSGIDARICISAGLPHGKPVSGGAFGVPADFQGKEFHCADQHPRSQSLQIIAV